MAALVGVLLSLFLLKGDLDLIGDLATWEVERIGDLLFNTDLAGDLSFYSGDFDLIGDLLTLIGDFETLNGDLSFFNGDLDSFIFLKFVPKFDRYCELVDTVLFES